MPISPARGEHRVHSPQVVVAELGRRRRLERGNPAALGVQALEDGTDDAVLAGGVETLEHEQNAVAGLRVEPLLQDFELCSQLVEVSLRYVLVSEAEIVACVAPRDPGFGSGSNTNLREHRVILRQRLS